jgi:hypothetical protein
MGNIKGFREFEPNTLVEELVEYIEKQLPHFVKSQTFDKIMVIKKNEVQHSTAFVVFMMKHQDKFTFVPEAPQTGSYKIDVAVVDKFSDDIIFTIEAKILPTPIKKGNKKRAESEYVYATNGENGAGLERFRNGYHGLDWNENPLPESGMIAYIKENDFNFWFDKINQWVIDASWGESEKLEEIYFESIAKLKSKHIRVDNSEVILHHFWVHVA